MKTEMKAGFLSLVVMAFLIFGIGVVIAEPAGVNIISEGSPEFRALPPALTLDASAGNITEVNLTAVSITRTWQGYYGRVSGAVVLADASNNTMYNWTFTTVAGEVFASNTSVSDWSSVSCVNSSTALSTSNIDSWLNVGPGDADSVGNTFSGVYSDAQGFYVGSVQINSSDMCSVAYTFVNGTAQSSSFAQVILTTGSNVIWTGLLENGVDGFKYGSEKYDFQLLVGEDGHNGDSNPTTYYFYVELG